MNKFYYLTPSKIKDLYQKPSRHVKNYLDILEIASGSNHLLMKGVNNKQNAYKDENNINIKNLTL
jgi:hypothetical protein